MHPIIKLIWQKAIDLGFKFNESDAHDMYLAIQQDTLEKHKVCDKCYAVGITDSDCVCVHGKPNMIELEFKCCTCCGTLTSDGYPAETEFNSKQLRVSQ